MDIYEMVTNRIIAQLEQGYIPWKKPWADCLEGNFNRISRKPYSLLNQLLLSRGGEYATFRQWNQIGGRVRKGEKAEIVVFWKLKDVEERDAAGETRIRKVPLLRYYNVFHISQVENVLPLQMTKVFDTDPIEQAEELLHRYTKREGIRLTIGKSDRAFYRPSDDSITLPALTQFEKSEEFYSTAFHECGHSTMKKNRCDREADNMHAFFGNEDYSREELIAEITSAAILNSMGIETTDTFRNSCAYIQNWIRVLKNDKRFVITAAGKAEKAAKYILGEMQGDIDEIR